VKEEHQKIKNNLKFETFSFKIIILHF